MPKTIINTLRYHWESLRDNGQLPMRSEIDPREMPEVLDNMFILEQLDDKDVRVRIAGLSLCEMMGMEVRGQTPLTFFEDNMRDPFLSIVTDVLELPATAHLDIRAKDQLGNKFNTQMELLPLRSEFGEIRRVIGCVLPLERAYTAPVRFQITEVVTKPVSIITPHSPSDFPGFEEPHPDFIFDDRSSFRTIEGNATTPSGRPNVKPSYLKVVN